MFPWDHVILTTMVVNIIATLIESGFSEYEARAYVALLRRRPASAYECAKESSLPTSKIYHVLSKLVEKGIALETVENEKRRFIPVEPHDLVATLRTKMDRNLTSLSEGLSKISSESDITYIWNLNDYKRFIDRARSVVADAKKTMLLSTWKEELEEVKDAVAERVKEKVKIAIVHFGKPEISFGEVFPHPIEDTIYNEKGGRGFTLVADSREVVIGTVFSDGSVDGAWSRNRGFVALAEDYVKHDIYIMKIVERFDRTLIARFGQNYHLLRDVFSNEEVKK
jgi:sugar-specific transcriptional regulator TrmB